MFTCYYFIKKIIICNLQYFMIQNLRGIIIRQPTRPPVCVINTKPANLELTININSQHRARLHSSFCPWVSAWPPLVDFFSMPGQTGWLLIYFIPVSEFVFVLSEAARQVQLCRRRRSCLLKWSRQCRISFSLKLRLHQQWEDQDQTDKK